MILLLLSVLIPLAFPYEPVEGLSMCMDAPFPHKYSSNSACDSPYILNSNMPSFPSNFRTGTTMLTFDLGLKIKQICSPTIDRIQLFTITYLFHKIL